MKNLFTILLLLFAFMIISCNHNNIEKGTPKCLKKEINKRFDKNSSGNAKVTEYLFQNKTVYVIDDGKQMPDGGFDVIDEKCKTLVFWVE